MANDYFSFRQFTIRQDRCAMKVGTDGTLLGAWAELPTNLPQRPPRILDIGTGTGLIALMMAQRFPTAHIVGIDIDEDAVRQAQENVADSPFADRIDIRLQDLADMKAQQTDDRAEDAETFDAIVSNPPYFTDALRCPDAQRSMARHTDTLSYRTLMDCAWCLLHDDGELSVVVPADCVSQMESEAILAGFFKRRDCAVKTTLRKAPKRHLLAFAKHACPLERTEGLLTSDWHDKLMKDFYL